MKLTEQKLRTIIQEEIKSITLNEGIDINDDMDGGEEGWNKLTKIKWDFKSKYFGKIEFKVLSGVLPKTLSFDSLQELYFDLLK